MKLSQPIMSALTYRYLRRILVCEEFKRCRIEFRHAGGATARFVGPDRTDLLGGTHPSRGSAGGKYATLPLVITERPIYIHTSQIDWIVVVVKGIGNGLARV